MELAIYCAKAKVIKDYELYKRIRPIILEHRVKVESEFMRAGKGICPPPFLVVEKLLDVPEDLKTLFETEKDQHH